MGLRPKKDISINDGSHMDVLIINALMDSLFQIFSTMVKLKIQPGIPETKQDNISRGVVSALTSMQAEGVNGSVALSLTLPAIRQISLGLLDQEITSVNKDAVDLAGELANMLVGGAKRILSEQGFDFDMQSPQLLQGEDHKIIHHFSGQTALLPIKINDDEFFIELNFI
ncbi:MAG: chemotaxis protein CheX [Gallionellaceae bacterium]